MLRKFKTLATLALTLVVVGALGAFAQDDTKTIKIGEKVPTFTLTDSKGKEHSLADYKGKTIVLEWYNPECPYVVGVYGKGVVKSTQEAIAKMDGEFIYLSVNSSAHKPKEEIVTIGDRFLKEHKLKQPILLDYDGQVGQALGARTTPHMFVIDGEGVLRYSGAYTDDPRFKDVEGCTNYVLNTLNQMAAGETVAPDQTRPWGCGVKYQK